MSETNRLLEANASYAEQFDKGDLPTPPAKRVTIVTCMDARLETGRMLELEEGDAHIIRNAGGIVTDDVLRSLVISQYLLGTREVVVIHHTRCGMLGFSDADLSDRIVEETGQRLPFALGAFENLEISLHESLERIRSSPFVPHRDSVRGFIFDVENGRLRELT